MAFTSRISLVGLTLLVAFISQIICHSYVTSPISRSNQAEITTGCRGPACLGPCDVPVSRIRRAPIPAMRGEPITVQWPRNNHAGGFIRFAWAPTAQSDSHAAFDSHVQQINCHEVGGCHPDDPSNPNGGDSGPADGSYRACTSNITVPLDVTDGLWTLQWAWFGGAFALGDYYSCVDYQISGGAMGSLTPVFIGGDYSYPNQAKCKFFNTDKLHVCVNEPCQTGLYPNSVQQSGPPASDQLGLMAPIPAPDASTSTSSSADTDMPTDSSTSGDSSISGDVDASTGDSISGAESASSSSGESMPIPDSSSSSSSTGDASSTSADVDTPVDTPVDSSSSGSALSGDASSSMGGDVPVVDSSSSSTGDAGMGGDVPSDPTSGTDASASSSGMGVDVPSGSSSGDASDSTSTSGDAGSSGSQAECILGHMVCVGASQYQTCTNGRSANYWAQPQTCQAGLKCAPMGDYIYCV